MEWGSGRQLGRFVAEMNGKEITFALPLNL